MFSIILARDSNYIIGNKNSLPWDLPKDLRYFKRKTQNQVVIMGWRTYKSLGKPLPNRVNIVLSSKARIVGTGVILCSSLKEVEQLCETNYKNKEWFIIGGGSLYTQAFNKCSKLYITDIEAQYEGDTKFNLDLSEFLLISTEYDEDKGVKLRFNTYLHKDC